MVCNRMACPGFEKDGYAHARSITKFAVTHRDLRVIESLIELLSARTNLTCTNLIRT